MSDTNSSFPELDNEKPKNKNGALIAIILILAIGVAAMAYLWSAKNTQLNNCNNHNLALQAEMDGMNQMMAGYVDNMSNDLRNDFQNMLDTYDALMEKDQNQSDSIMAQKEKILGLMDQLKRNKKMSAQQLFGLRKENETLRSIMKGYVVQIDSLNTLNLKLNTTLTSTREELSATSSERDQYKQEAAEKAAQVKKGAQLQAYSFESIGLKMKLNNTTTETNRARNTVQIKSSFTLSENPLTKPGSKMIYMQIIDPQGKVLQSRTSNVLQTDKMDIAYSDKKEVDYQNKRVDLAIYYDFKGAEAAKGNYKVNIYADGVVIGSDSFTLK